LIPSPDPLQVKNKAPAPVQITAEQLLREAKEHQDKPSAPPTQHIRDHQELEEYRYRKRKGLVFSDSSV
jgi:crooked neck